MRIILLTGWSESGKDTVADILVAEHGFLKYAFADPLKDLCASLYGFPREFGYTQEGKKKLWTVGNQQKTIRQILLDTALLDRARLGEDIYARETFNRILADQNENVVISDLRYVNELKYARHFAIKGFHHCEIWRVVRNGQTTSPVKDVSEFLLEALKPDAFIINDGVSIENLRVKVLEAINRSQSQNELSSSQNENDGCRIM